LLRCIRRTKKVSDCGGPWIFRARIDFIAALVLVCMGSVETFEEGYFEVKRHHEQPDEQRAQNDGSLQDLGSESAQAGFP